MSNCAPTVHSVHIYDKDSALVERLCGIISSTLKIGNSALIVATPSHAGRLAKELERSGVRLREYARDGRFTMLDAEVTLKSFMADGMPDHDLFMSSVGRLLQESEEKARGTDRRLTVFGEMVAVLWAKGNSPAAIALEEMWNDALRQRAFHLHCAYPRQLLLDEADNSSLKQVLEAHSHVMDYGFEPAVRKTA